MDSYEAMRQCIGKHTIQVARRIRRSTNLVYQWQEPHTDFTSSGAFNPLDRIEEIIDTAQECGQGDDALAPVYHLNRRYGMLAVPLARATGDDPVMTDLIKSIKEFSDLVQEVSGAMQDGRISPDEARRIDREGWDAVKAISTLLVKIETGQKAGK